MRYLYSLLIITSGFILLSNIRVLVFGGVMVADFREGIGFYPLEYLHASFLLFKDLFNITELIYMSYGNEYNFLDLLFNRYSYSARIFLISLVLAVFITYLLVIIFSVLPNKLKRIVTTVINFLESHPDVFIIVGLQLLVVYVFQQTGTLLVSIAVYDQEIYRLPIICLTIIPTIFLLKTALFLFREEENQEYVYFAKAKGLNHLHILLKHQFRNVIYSLFYRSKTIFTFMLSNLLIIEHLFNIKGVTNVLLWSHSATFFVTTMSIFVPLFLFFSIGEYIVMKHTGQEGEANADI